MTYCMFVFVLSFQHSTEASNSQNIITKMPYLEWIKYEIETPSKLYLASPMASLVALF